MVASFAPLTLCSLRFPKFSRAAINRAQSGLSRSAVCAGMGPKEHPRVWWRSCQSNHLWGKCRRILLVLSVVIGVPQKFADETLSAIDSLLTSFPRNSAPPFRAAILQSGQYSYNAAPMFSSVPAWNNLTASLGCPGTYSSNLACVRAANATTIQNIININSLGFDPIADNVTLVTNSAARRLSGNIANVPVLGGTNAQEGR